MEIIHIINSMAPFILLGFFLAGIMHVFVPARLYQQHLSKPTFKSVLYATLIAIPLPLCSCGVIPTAMSLRREGASRGSVISFLIATPQTGIDSILATYSMMGLPFAIVRPIAALVTALFGGALSNAVDKGHQEEEARELNKMVSAAEGEAPHGFIPKVKAVFKYAYFDMMQDIGKWLVVGLFIAGLITIYVPDSFLHQFSDNTLLSILVVLLCAIPMYLCATGSIPIAIALMMKGLSPGAALVLLMAGPAVNVASMIVINKVMGWKSLLVYLTSIILGATAFALIIDYMFPREVFLGQLAATESCCSMSDVSWFRWLCTALLFIFLINALVHRFFIKKKTMDNMIHIEGMKCSHCLASAQKAISEVKGVRSVEIDLASGNASVQGNYKTEDVARALESIGFKMTAGSAAEDNHVKTIHIDGMHCNHCLANAKKTISGIAGVESVDIDLASGNAVIKGDFKMEELTEAISSIGFSVTGEVCDQKKGSCGC